MNFLSKRFGAGFLLIFTWAVTIAATWRIAENPYYDLTNIITYADRLAHGGVLYKDFQAVYPPLSYWPAALVMKVFPNSYAATTAFAGISALLLLLANYRIFRLFAGRRHAAFAAICAYLGTNILCCTTGPSFFTYSYSYFGITLFAWFIWLTAKSLRSDSGHRIHAFLAGLLAGLCLVTKHERIASVLAVFAGLFILRFLFGRKTGMKNMAIVVGTAIAVGGIGWWLTIRESGWFYVSQALTGFGAMQGYASGNMPTLVQLQFQVGLLLLNIALLCFVGGWLVRGEKTRNASPRARLISFGVIAALAGLFLIGLEIYLTAQDARTLDIEKVTRLKQLSALMATMSAERGFLETVLIGIAGHLFFNMIPGALLIALIFFGWLVKRWKEILRLQFRMPRIRHMWLTLFFFAAAGAQVRWALWRTDFGGFSLMLPLLFYFVPRFAFVVAPTLEPIHLRRIHNAYLSIWLTAMIVCNIFLYAYEQKDARFRPIRLETDKGVIYLPRNAMNYAFADLVRYLRSHYSQDTRYVAIPFDGLEYWIGGTPTPAMWSAWLPGWHKPPWSTAREEDLKRNDIVFIEFLKNQTTFQMGLAEPPFSWYDGPWYPVIKWKEITPVLVDYMKVHTTPIADFGPTNSPYFRVYESHP